jgi:hypothetical protein
MSFGCPHSRSGFRIPHLKSSPIFFVSFVSFCGRFPAIRIPHLDASAFCLGLLCRSPDLCNLAPRISDRAGLRKRLLTNGFFYAQSSQKQRDLGRESSTQLILTPLDVSPIVSFTF